VPGGIRLEVDARENLPPVLADATELERVLVNLVANARDAVPADGGLIEVSIDPVRADEDRQASDSVDQVLLVVRDNGPGMDAETRKRVFEPFFTTKGSGGNGFGLTTVYAIVQRAGGNIEVDSEPDMGTTFTVRLPAYNGPDIQGEQRTSRETAAGETIWYCEGDERVRRDVLITLEDAGYQVQTAPDAEAMLALAATSTVAPSLVVTDSIAPGMPGTELVAIIRERFPGVPTVIISGRPPGETGTSEGPGHAWFVHKPYRRQELLARVAEALGIEPERDERASQTR